MRTWRNADYGERTISLKRDPSRTALEAAISCKQAWQSTSTSWGWKLVDLALLVREGFDEA